MIDLDLVRQHLKADEGVEDDLIEQYFASARSACEGYCNRKLYDEAADQISDYTAALAALVDAQEARDAAIEAAGDDDLLKQIATDRYTSARSAVLFRCNGIVINDIIIAAMLLMTGHFYRNRQEVVAGQYAGATQIPAGAKRLLEPYLWVGDLGGSA